MNPEADRRAPRLSFPLVLLAWLGSLGILTHGALTSPYAYTDAAFVPSFFFVELRVLVWLVLCSLAFFRFRGIGLGAPRLRDANLVPIALVFGVTLGCWAGVRLLAGVPLVDDVAVLVLRTTLLVGLTEEWVYRGFLYEGLRDRFGERRGALLSLAAFGSIHLMNALAGSPLWMAAIQACMAALTGSVLLFTARGTRSIWLVAAVHGLYDFFVFHTTTTETVYASLAVLVPLTTISLGIWSLRALGRDGAAAEPSPKLSDRAPSPPQGDHGKTSP